MEDELMEIFKIFDKNQDGFIDNEELKDVLIRLGENITDVSSNIKYQALNLTQCLNSLNLIVGRSQ